MVLDKDEDANSNNKSGLITYRDALLWFTNLDSTNGTKIARELHPPMKLSDGIKNDILICGNTKMWQYEDEVSIGTTRYHRCTGHAPLIWVYLWREHKT
jgi:hypothetical protein